MQIIPLFPVNPQAKHLILQGYKFPIFSSLIQACVDVCKQVAAAGYSQVGTMGLVGAEGVYREFWL